MLLSLLIKRDLLVSVKSRRTLLTDISSDPPRTEVHKWAAISKVKSARCSFLREYTTGIGIRYEYTVGHNDFLSPKHLRHQLLDPLSTIFSSPHSTQTSVNTTA
ncbi:unnamed protein product [Haemonchus placei]|uniref:Uncharacterized protein n=1 Tax=Haemonchus placei TaxID=6290 RepID=A0A0N4WIQ8_HAEPC|nr:unnamed protein product [Haemonchus placei]